MRPKYTKVRARSEKEGSGTVGWSLAALVPACFLMDVEGIAVLFQQFKAESTGFRQKNGIRKSGLVAAKALMCRLLFTDSW